MCVCVCVRVCAGSPLSARSFSPVRKLDIETQHKLRNRQRGNTAHRQAKPDAAAPSTRRPATAGRADRAAGMPAAATQSRTRSRSADGRGDVRRAGSAAQAPSGSVYTPTLAIPTNASLQPQNEAAIKLSLRRAARQMASVTGPVTGTGPAQHAVGVHATKQGQLSQSEYEQGYEYGYDTEYTQYDQRGGGSPRIAGGVRVSPRWRIPGHRPTRSEFCSAHTHTHTHTRSMQTLHAHIRIRSSFANLGTQGVNLFCLRLQALHVHILRYTQKNRKTRTCTRENVCACVCVQV